MQKIVIVDGNNMCSFALSTKVLTRYFELANLGKPYFYTRGNRGYVRVEDDMDDYFNVSLNDLGKKIIEKYEKELYSDENYFDYTTILRDDVNLVQAVIELNPKGLKVIEIPDDVIEWYIREEDNGIESIHEVHRFWF